MMETLEDTVKYKRTNNTEHKRAKNAEYQKRFRDRRNAQAKANYNGMVQDLIRCIDPKADGPRAAMIAIDVLKPALCTWSGRKMVRAVINTILGTDQLPADVQFALEDASIEVPLAR